MEHVILWGNIVEGYRVIGPFPTFFAAKAYLKGDPDLHEGARPKSADRVPAQILELDAPADITSTCKHDTPLLRQWGLGVVENNADPTEAIRREQVVELNTDAGQREKLEAKYGKGNVWDSTEMQAQFSVIGFMAPLIAVTRKSDGVKGSMFFQHHPRFYFNFEEHKD